MKPDKKKTIIQCPNCGYDKDFWESLSQAMARKDNNGLWEFAKVAACPKCKIVFILESEI